MSGYDVRFGDEELMLHVDGSGAVSVLAGGEWGAFDLPAFYQVLGIPMDDVLAGFDPATFAPAAFCAFLVDLAVNGPVKTPDGITHVLRHDTRQLVLDGLAAGCEVLGR